MASSKPVPPVELGAAEQQQGGVPLSGSCHCGKVRFTARSLTPHPFCVCHCLTDTKTAGAYNCNIMAQADSLQIEGEEHVKVYQAMRTSPDGSQYKSEHKRHFCEHCASYLWAAHSAYPQWIYPFSTAIDTPLPAVPAAKQVHIMTEFKLGHIHIPDGVPAGNRFPAYPKLSVEEWHRQNGLYGGNGLKGLEK